MTSSELQKLEALEEVQLLREEVSDAERCLELLSDYSLWTRARDEDSIVTYYRDSQSEFLVRGEAVIQASVFRILAMFSEEDLLPMLFPSLSQAVKLHSFTPYRTLTQYRYRLPWPIHDRELCVATSVYPVVESKSCLIVERTPLRSHYLGFPVPALSPGSVAMSVATSCMNIMYIEEELTQVTLIISADPNIVPFTQTFLPATLTNYVAQQEVFAIMQTIRTQADHFEQGPYFARISSRPDYYAAMQTQLEAYLKLFR